MNRYYKDIIDIAGEPQWWDEHAVPRYCEFSPAMLDIYAREVAFFRIACQNCGREFDVALSWSIIDQATGHEPLSHTWFTDLSYGDPPNVGCCMSGPTMNSVFIKTHSLWTRLVHGHWALEPRGR